MLAEITDIVWPQTIIVIIGLVGLGAIVLLALSIALAWRKFHGREKHGTEIAPQPLIVQAAEHFVTLGRFEMFEKEFRLYKEAEATEASNRRKGMYEKIDEAKDKVEELRKEVKSDLQRGEDNFNKRMDSFEAEMRDILKNR